jgi:hypothetical protein
MDLFKIEHTLVRICHMTGCAAIANVNVIKASELFGGAFSKPGKPISPSTKPTRFDGCCCWFLARCFPDHEFNSIHPLNDLQLSLLPHHQIMLVI